MTPTRRRPFSEEELAARDDEMLDRPDLAKRWKCSEKSVVRAEQRLGLPACRILRAIRYRLSDVLRVEQEGFTRLPKKWTGVRREREEVAAPEPFPQKKPRGTKRILESGEHS